MSFAQQFKLVSVDDYLAGEEASEDKHEFLSGTVYAMVGASNAHNIIATNLLRAVGNQLVQSGCRIFNSDTKVRIQTSNGVRFYYPDAQVVGDPNPQSDTFQDSPVVIFEVMSKSTRRIDEGEKRESYFSIDSLVTYVLFEQDSPAAVVLCRGENGIERTIFDQPDSTIRIEDPNLELCFPEIYQDIVFPV